MALSDLRSLTLESIGIIRGMEMMTKTILGLEKMPKLDDTADALAIAVCHAHTGGSKVRNYYTLK